MIVKKMPILQGFPDFETVKKLTKNHGFSEHFVPLFYDIETTGLSRNSTFLYLIGAVAYEENNWQMYQWMIENEEEEPELLKTFSGFLQDFSCTIQYNGDSFDQPYLDARYQIHGLSSPFAKLPSLDLYRELKPLKGLLKLSRMNQPSMESFLGITERNYCDGGACIRLYKQFASGKKPEAAWDTTKKIFLALGKYSPCYPILLFLMKITKHWIVKFKTINWPLPLKLITICLLNFQIIVKNST